MNFISQLRMLREAGQKVIVVGLGVSGVETCAFLLRLGIQVVGVERMREQEFLSRAKYGSRIEELRRAGALLQFGVDGESVSSVLSGVGLGVLSPGIAHESAVYSALERRNIPLVSELELGIELYRVPTVVVTGSNGKSTTVSLLQHLCISAGLRSVLCGNVGVPVVSGLGADCLEDKQSHHTQALVVEASSYQLEACRVLKPKVGVFLNISDNHLERHGTMERYLEAKLHLFTRQDQSDFALLNTDDRMLRSVLPRMKGKVFSFGQEIAAGENAPGALIEYHPREGRDKIILNLDGLVENYDLTGTRLLGLHNRYNIAAAILAARVLGVSSSEISRGIGSFAPLEHRVEFVRGASSQREQGPMVINDSKSTTVAASVAATRCILDTFPESRITLMIGGLAKAGSWEPLLKLLKAEQARLAPVACFGKDGPLLADHCEASQVACEVYPKLQDAVQEILPRLQPKEVLLLSPGCASFDEFSDFEDRGQAFKRYCLECNPPLP